jgi:hypothetical protein
MLSHFWRGAVLVAATCLVFAATANAADEKKKTEKKPPSECAGLDNAACTAKPVCSWYKEITTKKGKKRKAHCQKKPTHTAKTPAPKATTTPTPKT